MCILLNAKNKAVITRKNLLTKPPFRLKKRETPIPTGLTAHTAAQTVHLDSVNGAFTTPKCRIRARPLSLYPSLPQRWHKPSATHAYARKRTKLSLPRSGNKRHGYKVAIKKRKRKIKNKKTKKRKYRWSWQGPWRLCVAGCFAFFKAFVWFC